MDFDITHDGRTTLAVDYPGALVLGYPIDITGAALKAQAKTNVAALADSYRARLASASAGKLAEYRFKEEIARDPANAAAAELALIDREAAARGMDRDALIALINTQSAAYRQIALLIGVIEAETNAGLAAITDTAADIETQVQTVLGLAKPLAEAAFNEALALINGG